MKPKHPVGPLMTLSNMRSLGVRGLPSQVEGTGMHVCCM
jgi:hypothetical protein